MPSTPTVQGVTEVQNATNQTVVDPIKAPETAPKDLLVDLEEQQKGVYAKYNQVRTKIKTLESNLKKTTNMRKVQEELRINYHERDSLKASIEEFEKKIQSLRLERRALQKESEVNQKLDQLAQDEKDVKDKIKDNQFRIDKVRESIQETTSDRVKADLKATLNDLYADQKDLSERLDKVNHRMDEQQQNLKELDLEIEAKKQRASNEEQKKLLQINIDELDKQIKEKEYTLSNEKDPTKKEKLLGELNELAAQKSNLRNALEGLDTQ